MTTKYTIHGVEIDRFIAADDIIKDTSLNSMDLNDAFLNQAGLAAFYGSMYARAMGQAARLKLRRDVTYAKVSEKLREEHRLANNKITESQLTALVEKDPRSQAISEVYIAAMEIEQELRGAVEAIKNRRDMVIQLGATSREESKGTLRMTMTKGISDRSEELKAKLARSKA